MTFPFDWRNYLLVYDEDPYIYVVCMHCTSVVSLLLFLLGGYCVVKKKKSVSATYGKLLLLYMIVNICSQISWTSFYLPHLLLPATAGNTLGLFRLLGLAPELQLTLQFTLLGFLGGTTVLMFSYRYFILLPPGHFYKKRPVYRSFLVVVVIGSAVIPPPLIAWSCYSSDSNTVKDNLVKRFGYISRDLYDPQTLAFEMSVGSPLFITTIYLTVCICLMFCFICWIVRNIAVIFSVYSNFLSISVRKEHKSLTKMLYVQTGVTFGLISLPFTAFSIFMWFGVSACGILHICFVIYSFADPASTVIMLLMHSPYRSAVRDLLVRLGILKASVVVVPYVSSVHPRASSHSGGPYWHLLKGAKSPRPIDTFQREMFNPHGFMWYPDSSFGYPMPLPPPEIASPAYPPHPPSSLKEDFDETIPIDPDQEQRGFPHPMFPFYPPYMLLPPPPFPPMNSPSWPSFNPVPPPDSLSPQSSSRKKNYQKNNPRRFPDYIKDALNIRYEQHKYITGKEREVFAAQLGLTIEQVKIWFQNQRYKDKKMVVSVGEIEKLRPTSKNHPFQPPQ